MTGEPLDLRAQFCTEPLQNWRASNHCLTPTTYTRIAYTLSDQAGFCGVIAL